MDAWSNWQSDTHPICHVCKRSLPLCRRESCRRRMPSNFPHQKGTVMLAMLVSFTSATGIRLKYSFLNSLWHASQEAQLTRVDLTSGAQTKIASLRSSTNGEEGGPHGLAVQSGFAYVCDCPEHGASLTRVDLASGAKTIVANLTSPSGCAVGGGFAYVVEQGRVDGQLVQVSLPDASRSSDT